MANLHTLFDAEVARAAEDAAEQADPDGPFPEIHELFNFYRDTYFGGPNALGGVFVEWSSARMTLCGGYCKRLPGGALIKLSQPLLSLRPARDLKTVLLHEMIHAHVMVNGIRDTDPTGHGPPFLAFAAKINASIAPDPYRPAAGYNITQYHDWHAEVQSYRRHAWRCGRCNKEVWRAMNRPPQPADCVTKEGDRCNVAGCAYHRHVRECGGEFEKFAEPEGYVDRKRKKKETEGEGARKVGRNVEEGQRAITDWFKGGGESSGGEQQPGTLPALDAVLQHGQVTVAEPTAEERRRRAAEAALRRLGGAGGSMRAPGEGSSAPAAGAARAKPPGPREAPPDIIDLSDIPEIPLPPADAMAAPCCPICGARLLPDNAAVNAHIDACLAKNA